MSDEQSAKDVIDRFQKKQQRAPLSFLIGALALILIFAGSAVLYRWYQNPDSPIFAFRSETSTPTDTPSPTETPLPPSETPLPPTNTATQTTTPTITYTPTISGPFIYTVKEGDTLSSIAGQFAVEVIRIMEANELEGEAIFIGQQLLIPDPNEESPSPTPLPDNLPPGFIIDYRVQPEDSLIAIAIRFNSTLEAILEANETLDDQNAIFVGQILQIPVNLVTPAPTEPQQPVTTPGAIFTLTPTAEPSATP